MIQAITMHKTGCINNYNLFKTNIRFKKNFNIEKIFNNKNYSSNRKSISSHYLISAKIQMVQDNKLFIIIIKKLSKTFSLVIQIIIYFNVYLTLTLQKIWIQIKIQIIYNIKRAINLKHICILKIILKLQQFKINNCKTSGKFFKILIQTTIFIKTGKKDNICQQTVCRVSMIVVLVWRNHKIYFKWFVNKKSIVYRADQKILIIQKK